MLGRRLRRWECHAFLATVPFVSLEVAPKLRIPCSIDKLPLPIHHVLGVSIPRTRGFAHLLLHLPPRASFPLVRCVPDPMAGLLSFCTLSTSVSTGEDTVWTQDAAY